MICRRNQIKNIVIKNRVVESPFFNINGNSIPKNKSKLIINVFGVFCFLIVFFLVKQKFSDETISKQSNQQFIKYIENCRKITYNLNKLFVNYHNFEYIKISAVIPVFNEFLSLRLLVTNIFKII